MMPLRRFLIIDVVTQRTRLVTRNPWSTGLKNSEFCIPIRINLTTPRRTLEPIEITIPELTVTVSAEDGVQGER